MLAIILHMGVKILCTHTLALHSVVVSLLGYGMFLLVSTFGLILQHLLERYTHSGEEDINPLDSG